MFKPTKNWHPQPPKPLYIAMPKKRTLRSPTERDALEFYEGILNRVRINLAKQVLAHVEMTPEQFAVFQDYFITKVSWNVEIAPPLHYEDPPSSFS